MLRPNLAFLIAAPSILRKASGAQMAGRTASETLARYSAIIRLIVITSNQSVLSRNG
jgi:hypothetical protein